MKNTQILWLFPIITQCFISVLLPIFNSFNLESLCYVFLLATLPAFLFAIFCFVKQFHHRNIVQIAFWSSALMFLYMTILLTIYLAFQPNTAEMPIWDNTFAVLSYALMFALPSALYALLVLRLFLPKMPENPKDKMEN